MRSRIKLATLSALFVFSSAPHAQEVSVSHAQDEPSVQTQESPAPLKPDREFKKSPVSEENAPISITAQRLEAQKDRQIEATGEVELRSSEHAISADHLLYMQTTKDLSADGSVRVEQQGAVVTGTKLQLNMDTNVGDMVQPAFAFSDNKARGSAATMHMQGKKNLTFQNASYTTCPIGNNDWEVRMSELDMDRNTQIGQAYNARIVFKDVPIFYTPWMDFSLSSQRKSGFLGPIFGGTNNGGSEITLPFYWNIASNMDATLAPRVMDKRGTLYNNEFRYMSQNFASEVHYDVLPNDHLTEQKRSRAALLHTQNLWGGLGGAINYNAVSDDAYYRDLAGSLSGASQKNLLQEGLLTYGAPWWSASVRVQRYQTLQDPNAPVTIPYKRLPQINLSAQQVVAGSSMAMSAEYVDFRHADSSVVTGNRAVLNPSVSYQIIKDPAYFITPKLGVHNTQYNVDILGVQKHFDRTIPIFSLDSGMTMERELNTESNQYVQTLEPRAYYVYIPYVDQSMLPNFDTAQAPFTFTQMFTENRFFGSDRVGDANQVTMALTSRLLDADSGSERLRVTLGERFSMETPRVNLPGANTMASGDTTNKSDILFSVAGRVNKALSLDSMLQYNPNDSRSERYNVTARYMPEAGKVFNLGYRYLRDPVQQVDALRQVDLSAQWQLYGRWHAVGRYNYSLLDKRTVEVLAGLEYNQACWVVRLVGQQFATATNETSTGLFLQLELNELVQVGPDPLEALRLSVPGYTKLNEIPREQSAQSLR